MSKMVETIKEALEELGVNGNCRFHKGYITANEWKNAYLPELRKEFPDMWFTVNSNNHICVFAK